MQIELEVEINCLPATLGQSRDEYKTQYCWCIPDNAYTFCQVVEWIEMSLGLAISHLLRNKEQWDDACKVDAYLYDKRQGHQDFPQIATCSRTNNFANQTDHKHT